MSSSTEAIITRVERNADGTATVTFTKPSQTARLVVENPPLSLEGMTGATVAFGERFVTLGGSGTPWAERVGYARLRLVAQRVG